MNVCMLCMNPCDDEQDADITFAPRRAHYFVLLMCTAHYHIVYFALSPQTLLTYYEQYHTRLLLKDTSATFLLDI